MKGCANVGEPASGVLPMDRVGSWVEPLNR